MTHYFPDTKPYEVGITVILILYMRKLRQRKINQLAQSPSQAGGLVPVRMTGYNFKTDYKELLVQI